jgi:thioredoxin-related protein
MTPELIKIISHIADDHVKAFDELEKYIQQREQDAIKVYILSNSK